jgi:hypothetical protein
VRFVDLRFAMVGGIVLYTSVASTWLSEKYRQL